jgi:hypothetical protein
VTEYCHKFKGMVDALTDLGSPVNDRNLILNILRGLNQRFEHLEAIIQCSSAFLNFLKVRNDLLLEEMHLDTLGHALLLRCSMIALRLRLLSRNLLRHPDHPTATTTRT